MVKQYLEYALGPLDKAGLSGPLLDFYASRNGTFDKVEEVDPEIREYTIPDEEYKGEVLLPYTHPHGLMDYVYGAIGHAFRTRGYEPVVLSCRGALPLCLKKKDSIDAEGVCVNCRHHADTILDTYGFETVDLQADADEYSSIVQNIDDPASAKHRGVDISTYSIATARRYLRKYHINLDDPLERNVLEEFLRSSVALVDFTYNVLEERDISAIVGHHPAYIYGGTVLETGEEYGVPAISCAGGYLREDAVIFGNMKNRKGFVLFSDEETLRERVSTPLTAEEQEQVDHYMQGRQDGSTIRNMNYYVESAEGGLGLDRSSTVVGMFTNLIWDGSLSDSAVTFEDPFEWVKETLEYVGDLDVELILKPHPAEFHRETKVKIGEWAKANLQVPENVTILGADTDVDPYSLIHEIDVGIVFNSTLGMEAAYEGVPIITTGDTHYKYLGFTYDPATPEEYFELLSKIDELAMTEEEKEYARRYAHFLLVERHIPVQGLESVSDIHTLSHSAISQSENLDRLVEQAMADECSPRISN